MISEKLLAIQTELKAPKGNYNAFGKYKYRSCEDILEAIKPLLKKHDCCLAISDELVSIGDRYYIKATVSIINVDGEDKFKPIIVTGYAREAESQKGFDAMQLTGSTSSYARKYALNGMFLIDDTKDSDVTNKHGKDNDKKKADEDILKQIRGCRKVEELQLLRNSITEEDYPLYKDKFTTRRAILEA